MPLAATLKNAGLRLDVAAANAHVGRWLEEVANARVHATTGEQPSKRLAEERNALFALPELASVPETEPVRPGFALPVPTESPQHPLSVYQELLEARA